MVYENAHSGHKRRQRLNDSGCERKIDVARRFFPKIQANGVRAQKRGITRVFQPGRLTFGFIAPLEAYPDKPAPTMRDHEAMARMADDAGFVPIARDQRASAMSGK